MTAPRRSRWMLYGAYGFTGTLLARAAHAAGERPVLAGRDARKLEQLAGELGLEHATIDLDDAARLQRVIEASDVSMVVNCSGPYSATAAPLVEACLATGTNYADACGELEPLAATLRRSAEARSTGIVLLPGSSMLLVTDCLIATAHRELPAADQIELAITSGGTLSRGTARSMVESMEQVSVGRFDGVIGGVPSDRLHITVDLGGTFGRSRLTAVAWGDVVSAQATTGIENIVVYTNLSRAALGVARAGEQLARLPWVRSGMERVLSRLTAAKPNPSASELVRGPSTRLWVRLTAPDGGVVERWMTTPNPYRCTADALLAVVQHAASGAIAPGAHTPSQAHGAGFAESLDGVSFDPSRGTSNTTW